MISHIRGALHALFWVSSLAFAVSFGPYHDTAPLVPLAFGVVSLLSMLAVGQVRLTLDAERQRRIREERRRRDEESHGENAIGGSAEDIGIKRRQHAG